MSGVGTVGLGLVEGVEGGGEADVPLFGRVDIEVDADTADEGNDGGEGFDALLECLAGCKALRFVYVGTEAEHYDVVEHRGMILGEYSIEVKELRS